MCGQGGSLYPFAGMTGVGYTALLIDLDDTLVVEEQAAHQSFLIAARYVRHLYGVDPDDFVSSVKDAARELWYSLPTHQYARAIGIASREALWADFSDSTEDQKELTRYRDFYRLQTWINALKLNDIHDEHLAAVLSSLFIKERRSRHLLFDDTLGFLNAVAVMKLPMALITNGTPDLQRQKIEQSGLEHFFNAIVISGEIGYRKPRKEIFLACLQRLDAMASGAVMIGNTLDSDIAGANECGISSIWLNREKKKNTTAIRPDHEITGLMEALPIIRQNP